MDHGHPLARSYPLGMLWEEAELVVERLNREEVTRAIVMQNTIASILSEKGGKAFQKLIKDLSDNG